MKVSAVLPKVSFKAIKIVDNKKNKIGSEARKTIDKIVADTQIQQASESMDITFSRFGADMFMMDLRKSQKDSHLVKIMAPTDASVLVAKSAILKYAKN